MIDLSRGTRSTYQVIRVGGGQSVYIFFISSLGFRGCCLLLSHVVSSLAQRQLAAEHENSHTACSAYTINASNCLSGDHDVLSASPRNSDILRMAGIAIKSPNLKIEIGERIVPRGCRLHFSR